MIKKHLYILYADNNKTHIFRDELAALEYQKILLSLDIKSIIKKVKDEGMHSYGKYFR